MQGMGAVPPVAAPAASIWHREPGYAHQFIPAPFSAPLHLISLLLALALAPQLLEARSRVAPLHGARTRGNRFRTGALLLLTTSAACSSTTRLHIDDTERPAARLCGLDHIAPAAGIAAFVGRRFAIAERIRINLLSKRCSAPINHSCAT
jgi:hypothetical protein